MAKKAAKQKEEKIFISYNAAQAIAGMARGLKTSTYADYERIKSIIETCQKVADSFQGRIQEKLKELGVDELSQDHKDFKKVNMELTHEFSQASGIEVKEFQLFSKEELHASLDGISMSFDERDLLEKALVKS